MAKTRTQSEFRSSEKLTAESVSAVVDPIRQVYRAGAELIGGVAAAVADGYRTYAETLAKGDIARPDFDNSFITGLVNGWVAALGRAPDIIKASFDTLRNTATSGLRHKSSESSDPESKNGPFSATRRKRARVGKAAAV